MQVIIYTTVHKFGVRFKKKKKNDVLEASLLHHVLTSAMR